MIGTEAPTVVITRATPARTPTGSSEGPRGMTIILLQAALMVPPRNGTPIRATEITPPTIPTRTRVLRAAFIDQTVARRMDTAMTGITEAVARSVVKPTPETALQPYHPRPAMRIIVRTPTLLLGMIIRRMDMVLATIAKLIAQTAVEVLVGSAKAEGSDSLVPTAPRMLQPIVQRVGGTRIRSRRGSTALATRKSTRRGRTRRVHPTNAASLARREKKKRSRNRRSRKSQRF